MQEKESQNIEIVICDILLMTPVVLQTIFLTGICWNQFGLMEFFQSLHLNDL